MSKPLSAAQKLFNRAYRHLIRQNKKAMNENGECVYRGPNGLRCGVGGVLPNRLYKSSIEGKDITYLMDINPKIKEYFGQENASLLGEIQQTHDSINIKPRDWPKKLSEVARAFDLTVPKGVR